MEAGMSPSSSKYNPIYEEDSPIHHCCKCPQAQPPKKNHFQYDPTEDSSSSGSTPSSHAAWEGSCCKNDVWRGDFAPRYDCTPICKCKYCREYDEKEAAYSEDIVRLVGKEQLNNYTMWLHDSIMGAEPKPVFKPSGHQLKKLTPDAPSPTASESEAPEELPETSRLAAGGSPHSGQQPTQSPSQDSQSQSQSPSRPQSLKQTSRRKPRKLETSTMKMKKNVGRTRASDSRSNG